MSQGRDSAIAAVMVVCLVVALHYEVAEAANYTVGAASGWTFNVTTWPKGKRFRAGDILLFNYDPTVHSVVAVNKAGYNSCVAPRGAKLYKTGKDQIKLVKGPNFFACGFTGHCQSGMKIAVNAL